MKRETFPQGSLTDLSKVEGNPNSIFFLKVPSSATHLQLLETHLDPHTHFFLPQSQGSDVAGIETFLPCLCDLPTCHSEGACDMEAELRQQGPSQKGPVRAVPYNKVGRPDLTGAVSEPCPFECSRCDTEEQLHQGEAQQILC